MRAVPRRRGRWTRTRRRPVRRPRRTRAVRPVQASRPPLSSTAATRSEVQIWDKPEPTAPLLGPDRARSALDRAISSSELKRPGDHKGPPSDRRLRSSGPTWRHRIACQSRTEGAALRVRQRRGARLFGRSRTSPDRAPASSYGRRYRRWNDVASNARAARTRRVCSKARSCAGREPRGGEHRLEQRARRRPRGTVDSCDTSSGGARRTWRSPAAFSHPLDLPEGV